MCFAVRRLQLERAVHLAAVGALDDDGLVVHVLALRKQVSTCEHMEHNKRGMKE